MTVTRAQVLAWVRDGEKSRHPQASHIEKLGDRLASSEDLWRDYSLIAEIFGRHAELAYRQLPMHIALRWYSVPTRPAHPWQILNRPPANQRSTAGEQRAAHARIEKLAESLEKALRASAVNPILLYQSDRQRTAGILPLVARQPGGDSILLRLRREAKSSDNIIANEKRPSGSRKTAAYEKKPAAAQAHLLEHEKQAGVREKLFVRGLAHFLQYGFEKPTKFNRRIKAFLADLVREMNYLDGEVSDRDAESIRSSLRTDRDTGRSRKKTK